MNSLFTILCSPPVAPVNYVIAGMVIAALLGLWFSDSGKSELDKIQNA